MIRGGEAPFEKQIEKSESLIFEVIFEWREKVLLQNFSPTPLGEKLRCFCGCQMSY
jgi:hypothetical protein